MNKKKSRNSAGPGTGGGPGSSRPMPRGAANKEPSGIRAANRPVSSSPSRNSAPAAGVEQDSQDKEGIYSNIRLTHACACLIGATVNVHTTDGSSFEGLFRVFSPNLGITLEQAHVVGPNDPTKIDPDKVKTNIVFPFNEVVSVTACDVDLEYAAKESFQTDTQISATRRGGDGNAVRELERWEPDDLEMDNDGALETLTSNGWSPEDMFKRNEEDYGIKTTFKDNLEGYTVQLESVNKNTEEYREREARAKQVAREMEGNSTAVELENGDEEEAFSAVQRAPSHRDEGGSGKYVTPARRQSRDGPSGSSGKPQHVNTGNVRQPAQRSTPPPHDRDRGNGGRVNRHSSERDYHHQGGHHSGRDQHSRGDYGRGGAQAHDNRRDMQANRRSGGGGNYGMKGEHMTGPPQSMSHRGPPPMAGGIHRQAKSQSDQMTDLREFGANFQLANQGPPPFPGKQHSPKGHHHGDANRGASRSPPTSAPPAAKVSSPPTPGQEQKRYSPSTASAAHIPVASINQKQEGEVSAPPTPAVVASAPAETSTAPPASSSASSTPASIAGKSSLNPNAGEFVFNPKPPSAANVRPPSASPHQQQRAVTPATSHPGIPSPAVPIPYNAQFAPMYMTGPFPQQGMVHGAGPGASYPQPFAGTPQIASPLQQQQQQPQHMGQQQGPVGFQGVSGADGNGSIQGGRQPPHQGANEATAANIAAATGQPLVAPAPNHSPLVSQGNTEQSQQQSLANFGYVMNPQMIAANHHLVRLPQGVMPIPGNAVNHMSQVQPNTSNGVGPIPPQHVQENSGSVSLPHMANQGPGVPWMPGNPSAGQPNIPPPPTGQPPPNANAAPPQGPPPQHPQGPQSSSGSGGGNGNTPAQSPGPLQLIPHPHAQQPMFAAGSPAAAYQMHLVPFHNAAAPGQIHPQHSMIPSQAAAHHQQPVTSIAGQIPPPMYQYLPQQHGPAQGMLGQHNSPFLIQQISIQQQQAAAVQQQQQPPQWGANFEDQTQPPNSSYSPSPPTSVTENSSPQQPSSKGDKDESTEAEVEVGRPQTPESPPSNNAATQNSFTATNNDSSCRMPLPDESSEHSAPVATFMPPQLVAPNTAFYSAPPQQVFAQFPFATNSPIHHVPIHPGHVYASVAPPGGGVYAPMAMNWQFAPPPPHPHPSLHEFRPVQEEQDINRSSPHRRSPPDSKKRQTDTAPSVTPIQGIRIMSPPHKQQRRFLSGPPQGPPPGMLPHSPRSPYSTRIHPHRSLWVHDNNRNFQTVPTKHQGSKPDGGYGGRGDRPVGKTRNFNAGPGYPASGGGGGGRKAEGPTPLNVLSIPSALSGGAGNGNRESMNREPMNNSPRKSKGRG